MAIRSIATTLGMLVDAEASLAKLAAVRLDAKARYHVAKLLKLVTAETRHFHDQRMEIVKELGTEREPTGEERARLGPDKVHQIAPENLPAFRARLQELAAIEVTLPWGPVLSTWLESCADITAADLIALGPLGELVDPSDDTKHAGLPESNI